MENSGTVRRDGSIEVDVVVVGGGLAGLTAAAFASRTGAHVVVLEARSMPGGRARTVADGGFSFNEGPHAWFPAAGGAPVLDELGIAVDGATPSPLGSRLAKDGRLRVAPSITAMRDAVRLSARLARDAADPGLVRISAEEWVDGRVRSVSGRELAAALIRVTSYTGDLGSMSADAAAGQLRVGLRGVVYLHGGWQQLVDGLGAVARAAGTRMESTQRVTGVEREGDRWAIATGDRRWIAGSVVLAAGGPGVADRLLGGASAQVAGVAAGARPVHAACLDVGLSRLARPRRTFALGLDTASYASVHTATARLALQGEVLHVMRYEPAPEVGVEELESVADVLQPGWREFELVRQTGLRRLVASDRPRPGVGLAGRPSHVVGDAPGVFVAGDWVGPTDLLAAASLVSGRAAGRAAAGSASAGRRRTEAEPAVGSPS